MTTAIAKPTAASLVPSKDDFLADTQIATGIKDDARLAYPYIGFYGAKTKDTDPLDAAGIETYEFYLNHVEPIRLKPFTMHVLQHAAFYTQVDDNMRPTAARLDCPDEAFQDGFRKHVFFLAAVRIPTKEGLSFIPAVGTMHSAQANALDKSVALLKIGNDAWTARGDLHKASVHACKPGGRFITTIWSDPAAATNSGREYNKGYSSVRPTPVAEVDAFNAWVQKDIGLICAVAGINNLRIEECKALIG